MAEESSSPPARAPAEESRHRRPVRSVLVTAGPCWKKNFRHRRLELPRDFPGARTTRDEALKTWGSSEDAGIDRRGSGEDAECRAETQDYAEHRRPGLQAQWMGGANRSVEAAVAPIAKLGEG